MTTTLTQTSGRLSSEQVDHFRREGYLKMNEQILPKAKFDALRSHFEVKLSRVAPDVRPESMDVPHFTDPKLFEWLFADEILDIVESIVGPDIALYSSHFICKPKGNGKRVPWHEDSAYWKGKLDPMEVVTVWLAIDPSTLENGCMSVIPRTHGNGYSEYEPVDKNLNVFANEIKKDQFDVSTAVPMILQAGEASLHDARLIHGSSANTSNIRRCGYTMRYISAKTKFNIEQFGKWHKIYLARGQDRAGNVYGDPTQVYSELARYREVNGKNGH